MLTVMSRHALPGASLAHIAMVASLVIGAAWPAETRADTCEDCHGNPRYFVQAPHINDYYQDWLGSPHKAAGVTCSQCHGGDPAARDADEAHAGVISPAVAASPLFYRRQPETCGRCHAENARQFAASRHSKALLGDSNAPTCTTCHSSMSRRPYARDIVAGACEACHGRGLELENPGAIAAAREILHRLGMAKAYLGWSRLHYESLGWPDDSESTIAGFQAAYDQILDGVHRFDLDASQGQSIALLTGLRAYFDAAWDRLQGEQEPGPGDN